jgi:hypothetical protein
MPPPSFFSKAALHFFQILQRAARFLTRALGKVNAPESKLKKTILHYGFS